MSRASVTRRGSAVRIPGTSFHSTTRLAPSARDEQRRRQVGAAAAERRHAAVRRLPDEAGDNGDRARAEERSDASPGQPRRGREVGCRAAVMAVGDDDLRGVDIGRAAARPGAAPRRRSAPTSAPRARRAGRSRAGRGVRARRSRRRARGTRAPRSSIVASSRRLAGPAGMRPRATSQVPAQEDGRGLGRVGAPPGGRRRRALEQQVGDAAERGRDNHERALVPLDRDPPPVRWPRRRRARPRRTSRLRARASAWSPRLPGPRSR